MFVKELIDSKFWMEGLIFLKGDKLVWFSLLFIGDVKKCEDFERLKIISVYVIYVNLCINLNEFLSFNYLVYVIGWVRRFVDNCRLS